MIRREDVADLRAGDVVEYHSYAWPEGHDVTGALYVRTYDGALCLADDAIRLGDGDVTAGNYHAGTLTVISRAPRPLYVNHDRTESVPGDVVRDADEGGDGRVWLADTAGDWWTPHAGSVYMAGRTLSQLGISVPARLRLLVDGTTGQVVP